MTVTTDALLSLHRALVEIPSVSHEEQAVADFAEGYLREHAGADARVERMGDNVLAFAGHGPRLLLASHLDTVPPGPGWTREPWQVEEHDGRIYGLGANDAKGPAAAMTAAFLEVAEQGGPCEVGLLLAAEEETGGNGTEVAWPALRDGGWVPEGVVVGEPTGLDIAIAQKGMLVLELRATGDGGHSAHARALGASNAIRALARDLMRLEELDLGPAHPELGETTLEPTLLEGGEGRNRVAERAKVILDLRTVPGVEPEAIVTRVRAAVESEVVVLSDRLGPRAVDADAAIVRAARAARPDAPLFGSRTMSDWVFFADVPAIKCGPGRSERSHQPDEYIEVEELRAGLGFYSALIDAFPALLGGA